MRNKEDISKSIARRINARLQLRSLVGWLLMDVASAALGAFGWCAATEIEALGTFTLELPRELRLTQESGFSDIRYFFGPDLSLSAPAGKALAVLSFVLAVLMIIQALTWLFRWFAGARKIRRYLRPIDDIAAAARTISHAPPEEGRFRDLTEAIDHLNAAAPNAKLSLGDEDMAGLETAVNGLIARMHETYRQQTRFVDDASHELRTPIAVIQGYINLLDRWGKNDEKVLNESIEAIKTESEHMKTLVEQLLFLARGDMGRQKFAPEPLDLADMLAEVRDESQMLDSRHPYALRSQGPFVVSADPAMLKQAVRILVDNAAKYTPPNGEILLRLRTAGACACIDVQDEGAGISDADAPHVFERFYRGDRARSSSAGGSGLGLSIAKWIVEQHGGFLEIVSFEGVGTRVTIHFPLGEKTAKPA